VRRTPSTIMLNRAQGVLFGQLAGDALGSQVEFMLPEQIRRLHPEGIRNLQPGGTWDTLAGQPTDDSEMALALARTLVKKREFDRAAIARSYVDWARSGPFDIGGTTATGIAALAGRGSPSRSSQANGALMRVSPVGIFAAGRPALAARLAREDAKLTHPHPVCQAASAAFAAAIAAGIAGADHRTMWSTGFAHAGEDDGAAVVRACLERSLTGGPADFNHNQGWVLTALWNAFHRLHAGQTIEEAVIETVMAGGDTDTNAAICGALLGAVSGRSGIPVRWRRLVLACRPVHGDEVRHPRPSTYWPDDALDLAEALLFANKAM
jgi:ADP-ribosyl-[dinitrogen reductase] hydrolase